MAWGVLGKAAGCVSPEFAHSAFWVFIFPLTTWAEPQPGFDRRWFTVGVLFVLCQASVRCHSRLSNLLLFAYKQLLSEQSLFLCCNHQLDLIYDKTRYVLETQNRDCQSTEFTDKPVIYFFLAQCSRRYEFSTIKFKSFYFSQSKMLKRGRGAFVA